MREVVVVGKVSGIVRGLADKLHSMPTTTPAILCMSHGASRGQVKQLLQIPTNLYLCPSWYRWGMTMIGALYTLMVGQNYVALLTPCIFVLTHVYHLFRNFIRLFIP